MDESLNPQIVLFSMLQLHKENFKMLHWKVCGHHFDNMHNNVTSKYYDMMADDVDVVAENLMRQGINPVNIIKAISIATKLQDAVFVNANIDYSRDDVISITDRIFYQLLRQIEVILNTAEIKDNIQNVGIKAYYESLHDKYDLEYRFLNKRRACENNM